MTFFKVLTIKQSVSATGGERSVPVLHARHIKYNSVVLSVLVHFSKHSNREETKKNTHLKAEIKATY